MQDLKPTIVFGQYDLSSFFIANLITALKVKNIPMTFKKDHNSGLSQVLNVELLLTKGITTSKIYGDTTIADFICGLKNSQESGGQKIERLGDNAEVDTAIHTLGKMRA